MVDDKIESLAAGYGVLVDKQTSQSRTIRRNLEDILTNPNARAMMTRGLYRDITFGTSRFKSTDGAEVDNIMCPRAPTTIGSSGATACVTRTNASNASRGAPVKKTLVLTKLSPSERARTPVISNGGK